MESGYIKYKNCKLVKKCNNEILEMNEKTIESNEIEYMGQIATRKHGTKRSWVQTLVKARIVKNIFSCVFLVVLEAMRLPLRTCCPVVN